MPSLVVDDAVGDEVARPVEVISGNAVIALVARVPVDVVRGTSEHFLPLTENT